MFLKCKYCCSLIETYSSVTQFCNRCGTKMQEQAKKTQKSYSNYGYSSCKCGPNSFHSSCGACYKKN